MLCGMILFLTPPSWRSSVGWPCHESCKTKHLSSLLPWCLSIILLLLWFYRKAVLLASGIMVAGGTAAYLQSRFSSKKPYSYGHSNGVQDDRENSYEVLKRNNNLKGTTRKRGGLKSLQVLTAILLSKMGQTGTRDLLALLGIVVSLSFCALTTCWFNIVLAF